MVATATASGRTPAGTVVTSTPGTATTPTSRVATLTLDKTAQVPVDANADGRLDAGDTVTYGFALTNTGTVTLTGVRVDDSRVAASCRTTTLAPGVGTTCTGVYVLTQADLDAGAVRNTATATGTGPDGTTATSAPDSTDTTLAARSGLSLGLTASAPVDTNGSGRVDAGDTVTYTFVVTNTGTRSVTGAAVTESLPPGVTCPTTALEPGESTTCTVAYVLTQADLDAGSVTNTATASGTDSAGAPVGAPGRSVTTPLPETAALALTLAVGTPTDANGNGVTDAGDRLPYTFTVTNTGSVTLTGTAVGDTLPGDPTCVATTLAPGASTTCTTVHVITQAEVDAGQVVDAGTATATRPTGEPVQLRHGQRHHPGRRDRDAGPGQDGRRPGGHEPRRPAQRRRHHHLLLRRHQPRDRHADRAPGDRPAAADGDRLPVDLGRPGADGDLHRSLRADPGRPRPRLRHEHGDRVGDLAHRGDRDLPVGHHDQPARGRGRAAARQDGGDADRDGRGRPDADGRGRHASRTRSRSRTPAA